MYIYIDYFTRLSVEYNTVPFLYLPEIDFTKGMPFEFFVSLA